MSQLCQVAAGQLTAEMVPGHDHVFGLVQRHRSNPDELTADLTQDRRHTLVFRHGRGQDDTIELLALYEISHIGEERLAGPVARVHDQFESGSPDTVQQALLHIDDILGIRVVIDHADQERPPEGQTARLRVGRIADLVHDTQDRLARIFLDCR